MKTNSQRVLIVGGTSGLGLALATLLCEKGEEVFVTGKHNPENVALIYLPLVIGAETKNMDEELDHILEKIGPVDLLVYAAGFSQIGTLDVLTDKEIDAMLNISLAVPAKLLQRILQRQKKLPGLIAITSTSQWIPRMEEPVYAATKAGLAMLVASVSLDPRIKKTLVVWPSGMNTKMQVGRKYKGILLDPSWVATQILEWYKTDFKYQLIRILRDPPRVETLEKQ